MVPRRIVVLKSNPIKLDWFNSHVHVIHTMCVNVIPLTHKSGWMCFYSVSLHLVFHYSNSCVEQNFVFLKTIKTKIQTNPSPSTLHDLLELNIDGPLLVPLIQVLLWSYGGRTLKPPGKCINSHNNSTHHTWKCKLVLLETAISLIRKRYWFQESGTGGVDMIYHVIKKYGSTFNLRIGQV